MSAVGHAVLQFCGRVEGHEHSVIHDRDAVAELVGFVHVMRRQQNGQARGFLQFGDHFPHRRARHRVEAGGRLVEEHDFGRVHQAARDFQAPAHSARKTADQFVGKFRQADGFQQLRDQSLALGARQSVELGVDHHVFARGQLRIGRERLRDHANGVADAVGIRDHVVPAHFGRSRGGRRQRRHHANQRRFSRAVRPQQAEDFPGVHREAHFLHGHEIAKLFFQFGDFDRVVFRRSSCRIW